MTKRWNFTGNVVGTDIVDETGIPYTNRGIVTNLNRLERENEQLKQEIKKLQEFQERVYNVSFGRGDVE